METLPDGKSSSMASWFRSHSSAILATALVVSNSGLLSEKAAVCLKALATAMAQM